MTADTEKTSANKNTTCLICDASVGVSTRNSCPIFHQNVTTSDKPIFKVIGLVLGVEVQENLVHSAVVCKKCFKLFNEIDELQERISEIQFEVKSNYNKTIRKYDGSLPPEENTEEQKPTVVTSDSKARVKQGPGRPRLKKIPESPSEIKSPQSGSYVENTTKTVGDEEITIMYCEQKSLLGFGPYRRLFGSPFHALLLQFEFEIGNPSFVSSYDLTQQVVTFFTITCQKTNNHVQKRIEAREKFKKEEKNVLK
ncbi:hypothetical protein J6590_086784 [Homalodisca vitripennis]|nr:hypothetical protein J6590_086784 [Homalodisca vitripennis]